MSSSSSSPSSLFWSPLVVESHYDTWSESYLGTIRSSKDPGKPLHCQASYQNTPSTGNLIMKPHQGNLLCMLTMFLQTIGDQVVWNLSQDTQGITLRLDLTTDAAATSSSTSQVKNSSSKKHKAPSRRKRDRQRLLNHLAKKRTPADPTNPVIKSQHCGPQHNEDQAAGATFPVVSVINSLNVLVRQAGGKFTVNSPPKIPQIDLFPPKP